MEARRFDALLRRSTATGSSRRALLKGIAGAALVSGGRW